MANQYANETIKDTAAKVLQPLVFAGVIFEGGIISYDSNIITGGLGAQRLSYLNKFLLEYLDL